MDKIRIVFIVNRLDIGGTESALFNLIELMDKKIFDVCVFTLFQDGDWDMRFRDAGIKIINPYSRLKEPKGVFSKVLNLIRITYIDYFFKKNSKNLLAISCRERFDIVVSYQVYSPYENVGFPRYGKTVKYVHGNVITNERYGYLQLQMKNANLKYDKVICVSDDARNAFSKLLGRKERICTVFNPINGKRIEELSLEKTVFPSSKPFICAVGRLSAEKGFLRLINVFSRLVENGCDYDLVLVGDGNERNKIEQAIIDADLSQKVFMLGHKDNPYPYIKNCVFTVLPSFTEGLSVVAMESICLGTPVVSSYQSTGEIFGTEICGIITNNDDNSLYNGIYEMAMNKDFYSIAKKGAMNRSNYFINNSMISEIEKILFEMIK